ncbi:hypothetical protein C8Q77DRAFT_1140151 [Trametes polyzona]|nr:hypothetical protein C8Q77DRAFT_1140151 [Trametes polyzona]
MLREAARSSTLRRYFGSSWSGTRSPYLGHGVAFKLENRSAPISSWSPSSFASATSSAFSVAVIFGRAGVDGVPAAVVAFPFISLFALNMPAAIFCAFSLFSLIDCSWVNDLILGGMGLAAFARLRTARCGTFRM